MQIKWKVVHTIFYGKQDKTIIFRYFTYLKHSN